MISRSEDLALIANNENAINQISSHVDSWQTTFSNFFTEFEEYASAYRLIELGGSRPANVYTRSRVGETIRACEALTTSIFRMMTSQDPFYDIVSMNSAQSPEELFRTHLLLRYQDYKTKYKKKLLRAVRSTTLFGTGIVETPYMQHYENGILKWESLGFMPRSLLQCAFEPTTIFLEETPWLAFLDYYSDEQLLDKAESDPDNWNPQMIQTAIDNSSASSGSVSSRIEERRQRAGYRDLPLHEVCTYYGRLKDARREDKSLWMVRLINQKYPIWAGAIPSATGRIPFQVGKYLDFELEPYGYGVGRLGRASQRGLDENRNSYSDIIRMSLYNMWIKDRQAGVRNIDLKIRPLGVIEADNIQGIKPYTPDLNSVNYGFKLEEVLRAEHQGNTGATPNLQAQVTDASATESSIAQNEAIRRVSVTAEDMAESYIRDYQIEKHNYNSAWLQMDRGIGLPGMKIPQRVNRMNMAHDIEPFIKITTDKDFRPRRLEFLEKFLMFGTSIRNQIPRNIDLTQAFEEFARQLDLDPGRIVLPPDQVSPTSVQDQMMGNLKNARLAAQELGPALPDGQMASDFEGDIMQTGVGPTMVTP